MSHDISIVFQERFACKYLSENRRLGFRNLTNFPNAEYDERVHAVWIRVTGISELEIENYSFVAFLCKVESTFQHSNKLPKERFEGKFKGNGMVVFNSENKPWQYEGRANKHNNGQQHELCVLVRGGKPSCCDSPPPQQHSTGGCSSARSPATTHEVIATFRSTPFRISSGRSAREKKKRTAQAQQPAADSHSAMQELTSGSSSMEVTSSSAETKMQKVRKGNHLHTNTTQTPTCAKADLNVVPVFDHRLVQPFPRKSESVSCQGASDCPSSLPAYQGVGQQQHVELNQHPIFQGDCSATPVVASFPPLNVGFSGGAADVQGLHSGEGAMPAAAEAQTDTESLDEGGGERGATSAQLGYSRNHKRKTADIHQGRSAPPSLRVPDALAPAATTSPSVSTLFFPPSSLSTPLSFSQDYRDDFESAMDDVAGYSVGVPSSFKELTVESAEGPAENTATACERNGAEGEVEEDSVDGTELSSPWSRNVCGGKDIITAEDLGMVADSFNYDGDDMETALLLDQLDKQSGC